MLCLSLCFIYNKIEQCARLRVHGIGFNKIAEVKKAIVWLLFINIDTVCCRYVSSLIAVL